VAVVSPSLRVDLSEPPWPDLATKPKKVMKLGDGAVAFTAVAGGMTSGRASAALRIDLPDGRAILIETSLRALHAAVAALVARHGEPFMRHELSDREHKLGLAIVDLTRQLTEAKNRLGEPVEINLEQGDAVYDREQRLRRALSLARSMLLSGERLTEAAAQEIDDALTDRMVGS
jgi:hypothetical protein